MIVKRFHDDKLAQASYLIGCGRTGSAVVIDPTRDAEQYTRAAQAEGVRITHVTETHIHADFVSGARELAARTGATLYLSDAGDDDWKYAYAKADGAVLLRDGDTVMVGHVRLDVVHTPGHTPEHLSFVVTDTVSANEPMAIVTGDFVFVGDVGRPDLLEKAANMPNTMERAARTLHRSLEKLARYPDWVQVWPGHGAGSACGKGMSAVPQSTVGYERRFNWAFSAGSEDEFVRAVLAGQPEPPKYFARMKRINRDGPPVLGAMRRPERLPHSRLAELLDAGATIVDTRHATAYAAAHVPGTVSIPLNRSFNTWAGWLLPYEQDIYVVVDERGASAVDEVVRDLAMVGLDRVAGWFTSEVIEHWTRSGRTVGTVPQLGAAELAAHLRDGGVTVVDVRGRAEWEAGHLPGVVNIPLGYLTDHLSELPRDEPLVMQCQGGGRSAIAASVLRAQGFRNVMNLAGGYAAWQAAGFPVERESQEREHA